MKLFYKKLILIFLFCFIPYNLILAAELRVLQLKTDFTVDAPRWSLTNSQPPTNKNKTIEWLSKVKHYSINEKWESCLKFIEKVEPKAKSLSPWILIYKLKCSQGIAKSSPRRYLPLNQALKQVDLNSQWLVEGAYKNKLRDSYIDGLMELLNIEFKSNRNNFWNTMSRILKFESWLSQEQVAKVYKLSGELAFIQQNVALALNYFQRSDQAQPSTEIQNRIASIQSALSKPEITKSEISVIEPALSITGSQIENDLYIRMKNANESDDIQAVVDDGVEYLNKFPGGIYAGWAKEKIFSILNQFSRESESKLKLVRKRIFNKIEDAENRLVCSWASQLFYNSNFKDSSILFEICLKKNDFYRKSYYLNLAGQSNSFIGNYKKAEEYFQVVIEMYPGSEEYIESLARLGLVQIRLNNYSSALANFEKLASYRTSTTWDLIGLYWAWRTAQVLKNSNADNYAKALVELYPVTYYGLIARATLSNNILDLPSDKKNISTSFWLTPFENLAWERFLLLLQAGWLEEANEELMSLPEPKNINQKLVFSRLAQLANQHFNSSKLLNDVLTEKPNLVSKEVLSLAFPREFDSELKEQLKKYNFKMELALALIRQESSFQTDAVSKSNAAGLMQIVPGTAKDSAQYLNYKKKINHPEDLFNPGFNIYLGLSYLNRMIRAFDGNVHLALASYNLGIGRLRRWLSLRDGIAQVKVNESESTFSFESDLWIDELPWSETSFYVKSVMRNFLIYQVLNNQNVQLSPPYWTSAFTEREVK